MTSDYIGLILSSSFVSIILAHENEPWHPVLTVAMDAAKPKEMTMPTYTLSDGNCTDKFSTLADAASAAEDWYGYMLDDDDDVSDELRAVIHGADFDGVETVDGLHEKISDWEKKIAEAMGKTSFSGHGNYHVSAADQAGLNLVCKKIVRCDSGQALGESCHWDGAEGDLEQVEWMPEHLRASHAAAGNQGTWPHNGSVRLMCCPECAEALRADMAGE